MKRSPGSNSALSSTAVVIIECAAPTLAIGLERVLSRDGRITVTNDQADTDIFTAAPLLILFDDGTSLDTLPSLRHTEKPPALLAVLNEASLLTRSLLRHIGADFVSSKITPHDLCDTVVLAALANDRLTAREQAVYHQLRAGSSLTDVASRLGITLTTARTHAQNLYGKLGVSGKTGLTRPSP